jgi:CMP-N,N'-diacetyllegionaminic acid synthase
VKVLGVIPARGGSKGVPRKNVAQLAGRPLLAYTCEAARSSRLLDRVIISTDDEEILRVARGHGTDAPFIRPAALAADDTPMMDVIRHAVAELARQGYAADAVALLQPTSPLRTSEHIDRAIELLQSSGADTVVSVVRVPHPFNPSSLMHMEGQYLVPNDPGSALRRQDKPMLFARNGPAILILTNKAIEHGAPYALKVAGFEMSAADSIDIDTPDDLLFAEFRLAHRSATPSC